MYVEGNRLYTFFAQRFKFLAVPFLCASFRFCSQANIFHALHSIYAHIVVIVYRFLFVCLFVCFETHKNYMVFKAFIKISFHFIQQNQHEIQIQVSGQFSNDIPHSSLHSVVHMFFCKVLEFFCSF